MTRALQAIGDPRTIDLLVQCLDDERREVRREAVKILGDLGQPQAIPSLLPILSSDDPRLRDDVADALGRLRANAEGETKSAAEEALP